MKPDNNKKNTIHDVARIAGTSATTVSRVLSDSGYPVSEGLRKRVLKAVNDLNFSPNTLAQSLKSSNNKEVGIIVPNISNPFYSMAILGVERVMQSDGYTLLLCNTFRQGEKEREYLKMLYDKQVTGVIVSAAAENGGNVAQFAEKGMNFVLLDQKIEGVNCNNINFDFRQGGRLATEYLIKKGHRKIALITTPITRWSRSEIYKGYVNALAEGNMQNTQPDVLEGDAEQDDNESVYEHLVGRQMAKKFVEQKCPATGAICVNDMVAFGFIQELNIQGIRVPEDVSVIGFDDIPFASMFSPALTTIRCSAIDIGMVAGRILIDRIEGRAMYDSNLKIEPEVIERCTVKDINGI